MTIKTTTSESHRENMSYNTSEHAIWTREETAQLILWLEKPENQQKIRKGSGITKRQVVSEIAATIPTKPLVKVGYKYDNLLKSYREAVKLNGQSGWGLTKEDLDEGKKVLREKLLSRCPYFFRLDAILGDRPNVNPAVIFDSGLSQQESVGTTQQLIRAMGEGNRIREGWVEGEGGRGGREEERGEEEKECQGGSGKGRGEHGERKDSRGGRWEGFGRRRIGEMGEREKRRKNEKNNMYGEEEEGESSVRGGMGVDENYGELVYLSQVSAYGQQEYGEREDDGEGNEEVNRNEERVRRERRGIEIERKRGEIEENIQMEELSETEGRRIFSKTPKRQRSHSVFSSAIKPQQKRQFPQLLEDEEEDEVGGSEKKSSKKRKSGTLIDAVTILASAKTEGETQKFDFLNRHLVEQSQLRRKELELEREKLAIEKEKAQTEQKRTELMVLQFEASLRSNQHSSKPT